MLTTQLATLRSVAEAFVSAYEKTTLGHAATSV